jgi:predicted short-subunit dehydrogenase-like oxidoreductase (DUF2520 family)
MGRRSGVDGTDAHPMNRTIALIGPGRAGTTLALALTDHGYRVVGVAGRAPDSAATRAAALALDAPARLASEVGRGAEIVMVATPDHAIASAARAAAPSLEPGALVFHLAGSCNLDVFDGMLEALPDTATGVRTASLHPLQTFPSTSDGIERLYGSWAAVAGDPEIVTIASMLGLRAFEVAANDRARYHAAAVVASNHVIALLGQVARLAASANVPFEAFRPLVLTSVENGFGLGPARALTGPVARGDLKTVQAHLQALDPAERDAYRALAREASKLAERRDDALQRLLDDLRAAE